MAKACEIDSDSDAIILARAAKIVRNHMFEDAKPFTGLTEGCQKESVSPLLLALVNMILEGPTITDHDEGSKGTTPATLSIAQLIKFNSIKHRRKEPSTEAISVRHNSAQETPLPIYVGLMLHGHTRKKELVDRLYHVGLSVSYNHILCLSAHMGNQVCEQFHTDHVVCPPRLRGNIFTTSAVDNIDYNPSSTTSKESFHSTGISLFQHLKFDHEGVVERNITIEAESQNTSSKAANKLPHYYTEVPPVTDSIKKSSVSVPIVSSLDRTNYKQHTEQEYLWLNHTKEVLATQNGTSEWVSWATYHASNKVMLSVLIPYYHCSMNLPTHWQ